jgi:hypothetical protein
VKKKGENLAEKKRGMEGRKDGKDGKDKRRKGKRMEKRREKRGENPIENYENYVILKVIGYVHVGVWVQVVGGLRPFFRILQTHQKTVLVSPERLWVVFVPIDRLQICQLSFFVVVLLLFSGDVLILTKPLGTQPAAFMRDWSKVPCKWERAAPHLTLKELDRAFKVACASMSRLNLNGESFHISC